MHSFIIFNVCVVECVCMCVCVCDVVYVSVCARVRENCFSVVWGGGGGDFCFCFLLFFCNVMVIVYNILCVHVLILYVCALIGLCVMALMVCVCECVEGGGGLCVDMRRYACCVYYSLHIPRCVVAWELQVSQTDSVSVVCQNLQSYILMYL